MQYITTARERYQYARSFVQRIVSDIEAGGHWIVNFHHNLNSIDHGWDRAILDEFVPLLGKPEQAKNLGTDFIRRIDQDYESNKSEFWWPTALTTKQQASDSHLFRTLLEFTLRMFQDGSLPDLNRQTGHLALWVSDAVELMNQNDFRSEILPSYFKELT